MKDFVSSHGSRVVTLIATTSVVCAILVPYGFPWAGVAGASFTFFAAALLAMRSTRAIRQVIREVEAEPRPIIIVRERARCF